MLVHNSLSKVVIVIVVAGLLLMPLPMNSLWWREALNSSHVVLFLIISFLFYNKLKKRFPYSKNIYLYFYVLVIGMLFGVLLECVQSLVHREASLVDVYRDFLGIMTALCLQASLDLKRASKKLMPVFLFLTAVCFMLVAMAPLVKLSHHYIARNNDFPVIVNFDAPWISSFIRFKNTEISRSENKSKTAMYDFYEIKFKEGKYPGVSVIETEPDWSNYSRLRLNIYSRYSHNVYLVLRIHDGDHNNEITDRYNKRIIVAPGLNEIEIALEQVLQGPVDRLLDLTNVAGLIFFAPNPDEPLMLEMSNIYLE